MIHVLVANSNNEEGQRWRSQLSKSGYSVAPECLTLSELVFLLSREKVHIVICSMNLVEKNAFTVLNAITRFFPRVKLILVGRPRYVDLAKILNNTADVVAKRDFDTDLEKYCERFNMGDTGAKTSVEADTLLLLSEHFLSREEAAMLMGRSHPAWKPGYAVICISAVSYLSRINKVATHAMGAKCSGFFNTRPGELCMVIDNAPSEGICFNTAEELRRVLLTETNATFSIGISRQRMDAVELSTCVKEARRAASASYMYGQNSVVHINYLGDNDIEFIYPQHKQKRMIEQTIDGNRDEALNMLSQIFDVLKRQNKIKQSLINKFALSVLVDLNLAAASKSMTFDRMHLDSLALSKLQAAKTIEETYLFLKEGIIDFANEMDAISDVMRDALFMRLSELRDKKKELDIADLTHMLHTTICFINRAVAQNTGGDIFSFLDESQ